MKAVKLLLLTIAFAYVTFSCNKDTIDAPNGSLNASEYFEELHKSYDFNPWRRMLDVNHELV
ncbi:MAG: hypothetical protein ACOH2D_12690 [Gelidibacter sp.]